MLWKSQKDPNIRAFLQFPTMGSECKCHADNLGYMVAKSVTECFVVDGDLGFLAMLILTSTWPTDLSKGKKTPLLIGNLTKSERGSCFDWQG
jgi:hypothetical protein